MILSKPLLVALAATLVTPAGAAPVTLLPGGDQVVRTDPGGDGTTGFFAGTGFAFTADTFDASTVLDPSITDLVIDLSRINDSMTGPDNAASRLTVQRGDGAPFDLVSLTIPSFYIGGLVFYDGEVAGSDDARSVSDFVTPITDVIGLTGTTASGGTVTASFAPANAGTGATGLFRGNYFFENADPVFGPEAFGPGFEDLISLTLAIGETDDGLDPCDPANLSRVDPRFALSPPCAPDAADPPLANVTAFTDLSGALGPRNDLFLFGVDAITVDSPAPIPAPASLPLLAAGLGLLGLRRAR